VVILLLKIRIRESIKLKIYQITRPQRRHIIVKLNLIEVNTRNVWIYLYKNVMRLIFVFPSSNNYTIFSCPSYIPFRSFPIMPLGVHYYNNYFIYLFRYSCRALLHYMLKYRNLSRSIIRGTL